MLYKDLKPGDIWRYVNGVFIYRKLSNGKSIHCCSLRKQIFQEKSDRQVILVKSI